MSGHRSTCPILPCVLIALLLILFFFNAPAPTESDWNFSLVDDLRRPCEQADERTSLDYLSILQGKRNPG